MKGTEIQNKFIELRALGNTYDSISKTLNLNKCTLVEWNKKFEEDILKLKKIQTDEIKEKLLTDKKHRVEMFSEIFNEAKTELKEQPILMSYQKLVLLLLKISHYFDRLEFADFKMSYFLNQKNKDGNNNQNSERPLEAEQNFINGN